MQQAVFLFTQIFFVVLTVSAIGITIFTMIKRRDKGSIEYNKINSPVSNKLSKNESR